MKKLGLIYCVLAALAVAAFTLQAQETPTPQPPAEKSKPRQLALPDYVGGVTTRKQQAKIRNIVGKYAGQIKQLQEQIDAIKKQQQAEIEKLLTPAQIQVIRELQAEAQEEDANQEDASMP